MCVPHVEFWNILLLHAYTIITGFNKLFVVVVKFSFPAAGGRRGKLLGLCYCRSYKNALTIATPREHAQFSNHYF